MLVSIAHWIGTWHEIGVTHMEAHESRELCFRSNRQTEHGRQRRAQTLARLHEEERIDERFVVVLLLVIHRLDSAETRLPRDLTKPLCTGYGWMALGGRGRRQIRAKYKIQGFQSKNGDHTLE